MMEDLLTKEQQLILKYSRVYTDFLGKPAVSTLVKQELNWNYIVNYSTQHGVAPLIYKYLNGMGAKTLIPQPIYEKLRNSYFHTFSKNTRLFDDFNNILKGMEFEGIDSILLKGVVLAEFIYGDIGLRPMDDIDFLVKKNDLDAVQQILLDNGYISSQVIKSKFVNKYAKTHHLPQFIKGNHIIEVHWHIHNENNNYNVEINDLWRRAIPVQIGNRRVLILEAEDMLLNLCLHIDSHFPVGDIRFNGFCDIAEYIRKKKINWDAFLLICKKYKAFDNISKYLTLIHKYFEVNIPDIFIISENEPGDLEKRFILILQNKNHKPIEINSNIDSFTEVNGFKNKIRYLAGDIFPSRKFMMKRYKIKNKNKILLYYPLRFFSGIYKLIRYLIFKR
ncbi:MAG: nucleotidyltransferase family protein [Bacteroidia bacterium]|nr:nucleotidyltransferase family protein [Bacteroidia bacterium]